MSKGKAKNRNEKSDGRGGSYSRLPHCLIKHDAYRTASFRARAALDVLAQRHNGFNNGRISMSADELAHGLACQNHRANAKAIGELIARGIVSLEKDHPRGSRLAREYRLTYVSVLRGSVIIPATNDYLAWKVGSAGTVAKRGRPEKSRVAITTTDRPLSSVMTTTEAQKRPLEGEPILSPAEGGLRESGEPSVVTTATHIGSHTRGSKRALAGDRQHDEPERPDCISSDAWRAAAQAAAANPAAPSADEMRGRTIRFLAAAPRGTQTLLAAEARIADPKLSRFINHEGPLAPRACIALACAIAKLEGRQGRAAA